MCNAIYDISFVVLSLQILHISTHTHIEREREGGESGIVSKKESICSFRGKQTGRLSSSDDRKAKGGGEEMDKIRRRNGA